MEDKIKLALDQMSAVARDVATEQADGYILILLVDGRQHVATCLTEESMKGTLRLIAGAEPVRRAFRSVGQS